MHKSSCINNKFKFAFTSVVSFLFIYVMIFEFIIPGTSFLPSFTTLVYSLPSLWKEYDFFNRFLLTYTVVYLSLFLGFLVLYLKRIFIIKFYYVFPEFINLPNLLKYFPAFFFAILFTYWFQQNILAEYAYGFLYVVWLLSYSLMSSVPSVPQEFIDSAKTMGKTYNEIIAQIIWKHSLPKVFKRLEDSHYLLWVIVLIYEFIAETNGLGLIYKKALNYNDISVVLDLAVILSFVMLFGKMVLSAIKKRFVFWES